LLQPSAVPPVPPGVRRPSGSPVRRREHWSLTTLREKLVKIGARIVRHGRYVVFQMAEVAVPRALFAEILRRIDRLRPRPPPLPA
jgi:hypothetical protein